MRNGPGDRQLAFLVQHRREVRAVDVRHRDVLDVADVAEVVNAHDVLVRDLAGEQQLALEPPCDFGGQRRIGHHLRADDLDGDRDSELRVPCLIHRTHTADAQQPDDVIARTECLADGKRSVFWARWCEFRSAGGGVGIRTKSRLVFVGF